MLLNDSGIEFDLKPHLTLLFGYTLYKWLKINEFGIIK